MSDDFNMSFNAGSVPEPSEEDVFLLAERVREILDLSAIDMMGILNADKSDGTEFQEYEYKVMDMASEIISDALELEDDPDDEIILTIREMYASMMRELLDTFEKDVIAGQTHAFSSHNYTPYFDELEEKLIALLNSTALRISRASIIIRDHTPLDNDDLYYEVFEPDAFLLIGDMSETEKYRHRHLCALFNTYLTVRDDEVPDFISVHEPALNEQYTADKMNGLLDTPDFESVMAGYTIGDKAVIEGQAKVCINKIRNIFRADYDQAIKDASEGNSSGPGNVRDWGPSVREVMAVASTHIAIVTQLIQGPSLKGTEKPEFRGLS